MSSSDADISYLLSASIHSSEPKGDSPLYVQGAMFLLLKLIKPALLVAALAVAYLYAPAIGDVSGKALQRSVTRELDGAGTGGPQACRRLREGRWRCSVQRFQGDSGPPSYSVRMRDRRCWTATLRTGDNEPLPRRATGCVNLRDQRPRF